MKTYSQKPADVTRVWYEVDASELTLGRIAVEVAKLLTGKHKPSYTPHVDGGDYVVVTNAKSIQVTGKKMTDKTYYRHSGYPGSIRATSLEELLAKDPTQAIEKAVFGMLPKNKLRDGRMQRLKVFAEAEHTHAPQKPKKISLKKDNS